MSRSALVSLASLALLVAACEQSGTNQDASSDLSVSPDLRSLDGAPPVDQSPPIDLVPLPDLAHADLAQPADLAHVVGQVSASAADVVIYQGCMPIVPPDPLSVTARITFKNMGNVDVGPIAVAGGSIIKNLAALATFKMEAAMTGVIAPGMSETIQVKKAAGSLMPADGCRPVPCGDQVQLVVPYSGPGVPMGNQAVSAATQVMCTF